MELKDTPTPSIFGKLLMYRKMKGVSPHLLTAQGIVYRPNENVPFMWDVWLFKINCKLLHFFSVKNWMLSLQTANYGSYFMIRSLWMYSQSHQRPSKGCVSHSGFPILTLPWAFWCNHISDSSYVKLLFPYLSLRSGVMGSLRFGIYTTSGPGPHCNLRPSWQSPKIPYTCVLSILQAKQPLPNKTGKLG